MEKLNLPRVEVRIDASLKEKKIYDPIRKKWLIMTPEEWVRQNFIQFMINYLGVPRSLIKTEDGLFVGKKRKRSDILVYNNEAKPQYLVECKAVSVSLNQKTLEQAITYNSKLEAKCLIITNGLKHYIFTRNQKGEFDQIDRIPLYNEIS